ncbi:hypothetical protein TrST_g454 [Triparma strigata]|uniref:Large ribosomal subunit protein bL12 C-terminal domain-containing protein n=1 Tax=Triparma strigata TaxID=1606541 RepID=A0A9W7B3U5_9STRA|nr:hypothetical protein TrST_g454 [Triparma strigata]
MFSALTRSSVGRSLGGQFSKRTFISTVKKANESSGMVAQRFAREGARTSTTVTDRFNFLSSQSHVVPAMYNQFRQFSSEDEGKRPEASPDAPADAIPPPLAEDAGGKVEYSDKVVALCDQMLELNILELTSLTALFQERTGITDEMLVVAGGGAVGGGGGAGGGGAAEEEVKEEKVIFDVKLTGFDAKSKIKVIKEVRTITGLGLKEAKEMVEGAPKTIKKDVKKEEAEVLVEKLKAAGGEAELE